MITTTTVTRTTELWEIGDSYALSETFTLTAAPSKDSAVTAMKELMIKLSEQIDTWGSLLLDMACLKVAGRSEWQQPIAHLLPVLKRLGTEAQVEQALEEFAAENIPEFTGIESFEWGRVGGLYWEPTYWWGYLKQFHTPELQQAFWDKMQEFYDDCWEPHPKLMEEFKTQVLQSIEESDASTVEFDKSLYPTWYADVWKAKGLAIEETLQQKQRGCTPVQVGMSREDYLAAYIEGLNGGADVTGIHTAIKIFNMPEMSERRLKLYIQQRLASPTSPVAEKLLAATEGEQVYLLVQGMFNSGKYNRVRLPEEPEEVETEEVEQPLTPEELFEKCDGEANYEPLFADAARCEDIIMANIETIAENYGEDNAFSATGQEPQWLLTALLKAGAEFGSSGGSDDDDDDEILYEKQPVEPVVKHETKAPETGFTGKRVCITGKLGETRELWEAWIKDAGGTAVSSVSKTTDFLIAGSDAGSKLAKAQDLGVTVLDEAAAREAASYACEEVQKNWAALIIDKMTKDFPADTTDGYFKIDDSVEVHIEVGASVADIQTWLKERVGAGSFNEQYIDPEEVEEIKIEWIAADQANNVSVWYYDDEFGQIDKPSVKTLNTMDDALLWARNKNSGLGGHLSCIRVVTKAGDKETSEFAETLGFPSAFAYISDILVNHEDDPDLVEAMGGAEVVQKCFDEKDYSRLREVLAQGLWPKLQPHNS